MQNFCKNGQNLQFGLADKPLQPFVLCRFFLVRVTDAHFISVSFLNETVLEAAFKLMSDAHLMRRSGWNKHGVSQELDDAPALNPVLFIQAAAQHLVQIPALVVDGVVIWRVLLTLLVSHLKHNRAERLVSKSWSVMGTD